MSLSHCIERVTALDPDRHMVLRGLGAPVQARLYPLYALNLEIARAAWVSEEPLVCEMRLQWWSDALGDLGAGRAARGQPVLEACDFLLGDAEGAALLRGLVEARSWDVWAEPFEDEAALFTHLQATGGRLMWAAARALGAPETARAAVEGFGAGAALAGWLRSVPELEARGRWPLPEGSPAAVAALARAGLARMAKARAGRGTVPKSALPALLTGWQADGLLDLAAREPARVAAGQLQIAEMRKRGTLAWRALSGRW